ncbi:MAG: deoxyribodipyrimidine photo-lyase [Chitinophagaceae bacterium]|nr:deoxyribodipyrimidine photo-lyase [Chitinophagaceae bacterium]
MMKKLAIFWFRRDLRLDDNTALFHALSAYEEVLPIFIFDSNILHELPRNDSRVSFIYDTLQSIHNQLLSLGSGLKILHNTPENAFKDLLTTYSPDAVFTNHDYEPYARERDQNIRKLLDLHGIPLLTFKDQVIFEFNEVLKEDGTPYTVYTPYSKKWKAKLNGIPPVELNTSSQSSHFRPFDENYPFPALSEFGFNPGEYFIPTSANKDAIIKQYHETRDIPSLEGTTQLGIHLRFGTISIRQLVAQAMSMNEKFLNELIWREFYQQILWHFPHVVSSSFKKDYDHIQWRNHEDEFKAWCEGRTGYPIVDAGMRQLNQTGWMHNRVRMITASFLTKHLLIDWRWGEAYFAKKLLDFDLASNNGGWQWAAGCGVDAAPYFRIFNPYLQTLKFDPDLKYIRRWVPEWESLSYPAPIVDHTLARERCLSVFKSGLGK